MKKNLFGAVAAGLALALAITSFGCESGNDDPIARPTDADLANVLGSKFEFVATPTEYTATGTPISVEATKIGLVGTPVAGYSYNKFENGSQSYNIISGEWGKVNTSKPAVGDVINTKAETITLNAKDTTFEYGASSTAYAVRQLRLSTDAAITAGTGAYDTITALASQTDQERIDAAKTALTTAKNETADAQAAFNTVYNAMSAADKAAFDALTEEQKKAAQATYATLAAKKTAQEGAQNQFDWATVWKEGARYSILNTKTVNGATTGSLIYLTKLEGGKVVKTVDKKGGTAKATATGSYKVLSGGYLTGTILVTKFVQGDNTYVFDDDNDHYTLNGLEIYSSKISLDFDTQSLTKGKTTFNKAGRTLSISNKTLTSAKIETNFSSVADADKTYAFLLGKSHDTAQRAYDEATNRAVPHTGENIYAVSYSYVCK